MWDLVVKYSVVFFLSMFKFAGGPIAGSAFKLQVWETAIFTALGMIASVIIFTQLGEVIRNNLRNRLKKKGLYRVFSKKNRRVVRVWRKFGIIGITFLTPLLLTPIGGTIIALSFGAKRRYIILYMTISAVFWAYPIAYFFYKFEHGLQNFF